ncbi:MAG TPA: TMEM175 family protein [Propionicimonas sp.]|uniref:TMEM175 family protein n=1 Tax=Propionicimonas sp. TaxID=1955623 RepID=UPI002F3EB408
MASPNDLRPVERMLFFTDAVVAIAMTLLILPLLESVTEAARDGLTTVQFFAENDGQLASFCLSFFIILLFWRGHDRMMTRVEHQSSGMFWLNGLWMFSIVALPVVTAMVGAMETDPLQLGLYIGTMLATSLITTGILLILLRRPELLRDHEPKARGDLAPAGANSIMFALAFIIALTVPGASFWSLLALFLRAPLEHLLRRRLGA